MLYSPAPLHIPDGFLSLTISILSWLAAAVLVGIAIKRSQNQLQDRQIPLMGIIAAFIFAAQMINFPVAGGTSGHLLGGALAAIVLGPWAGMLVMTSVVALQGLMFQDGGLLVMGANILNMGLITALTGFGLYRTALNADRRTRLAVTALASWLSVMAAALLTSFQLWLSGTSPARIVFPAMLGVHALIGIGEALITTAALGFILQVRPGLLDKENAAAYGGKGWAAVGVLISLAVVLVSPLASASPDGLERVAQDLGFLELGQGARFEIFPDYTIPFFNDPIASSILAGILGLLTVGLAVYLIGRGLNQGRKSES